MAVTMRLSRLGNKNKPFYRIVVIDEKRKRESRYLEKIGEYNPFLDKNKLKIDGQKFVYWKAKGAKISKGLEKLLKNYPFKKD